MSIDSLLPDNRTAMEVALERTIRNKISEKYSPLETLWNPDDIPLKHLPWLAEAMGADEWNSNDSETIKRETLKTLWPRQREAGMGVALRRAVESFGVQVTVVPWHQVDGGTPYNLDIVAFAGDETVTAEIQTRMLDRAKRAASERDDITLTAAILAEQTINIGGVIRVLEYLRLEFSDA